MTTDITGMRTSRRRFLAGAAGLAGAAVWGTGCVLGQEDKPPRREPVWTHIYPDGEGQLPLTRSLVFSQGHVLGSSWRAGGGSVHAIDPVTGAARWRRRLASGIGAIDLAGDVMLVSPYATSDSWYGLDPASGEELWRSAAAPVNAPVVAGRRFFTTGTDAARGTTVHAIDLATGRTLWQAPVQSQSRTCAVVGDVVVVAGPDARLIGLNAADGRVRWRADVEGTPSEDELVSAGDTVILLATQRVTALDPATGRERWAADTDSAPWAFAAPPGTPPGRFFTTGPGEVVRYDLATGTRDWTADMDQGPLKANGVAIAEDRVFVSAGDKGTNYESNDLNPTGRVYALDLATGRRLWSHDTDGPGVDSFRVVPGTALVRQEGKDLYARDTGTGKPRWRVTTDDHNALEHPPVVAHGLVVWTTGQGLSAVPLA